MKAIAKFIFTFTFALTVATFAKAQDQTSATGHFSPQQTGEIEQIVHDYLINHPEVLSEMSQKLELQQQQAEEQRMATSAKGVKPVTNGDHIRGNANAPVKIIEFTDLECPFCKSFHPIMKQVMNDYEKDGKVAWVYRHFPLDDIHPKARKEAQAAECAGEVGGPDKFWTYVDKVFEVTPSNNKLDLTLLPKLAVQIGLDQTKFEACLQGDDKGGKYAAHIQANEDDAVASGGAGTPYTLVINSKGHIFPINGAQPYEAVKAIVDAALKEQ